jgi:hypothetical protein
MIIHPFVPKGKSAGGWNGGPRHWCFIKKLIIPEDRDACWGWTGSVDKNGYAKFVTGRAHRYAYEYLAGKEIPEGELICHTCDNPVCTNPRHLFTGTERDNALDRKAKSRGAAGNRHGTSIPVEKVAAIHKAIRGGMKHPMAAQVFGVSKSQVYLIHRELTWHFRSE